MININPAERVRLPRPVIWPNQQPWRHEQQDDSYRIKSLEVNAALNDQVAKVEVSQTFANPGSRPMEVSLVFPLPYDGAIDRLTLMIDGKEVSAKLLPASEARARYEEIVRKNRDPALLEWVGTGMFQTSVFPIPPGGERTVSLRYTQLCRKTDGVTDFLFPMSTAKYTSKPIEHIKFHATIESQQPIKNVYSPTHTVEIKRPDDGHAVVNFEASDEVPASDFRLFYDVGRGSIGASMLSYRPDESESSNRVVGNDTGDRRHREDGYFLLLASPEIKSADAAKQKKTVVFVVDRSGSMTGEKIEQAKGAVKFVLNNLHDGDLFNIIAFDSEVESWRPELQRFDDKTRKQALGFVEGINAGGSTNIDGALRTALVQLKDSNQPNIVLFMTDGLPTDGEVNETKIVDNAKHRNKAHARIFTFGVGFDLNSRLLDRLSSENFGQSEFVRPNENIETAVSALYRRISSPVLSDMKINWSFDDDPEEAFEPVNRVYPRAAHDLFAGEQLVLVGRYRTGGAAKVSISGNVNGKPQRFSFAANLVKRSSDSSLAFVEKLWAVRRVGEILDELDLKGQNPELVSELVALSKRYGIITPYTSFLADETADRFTADENQSLAGQRLQSLGATDGEIGVEQRAAKKALQAAQAPAEPSFAPSGGDQFADKAAVPMSRNVGAGGFAFRAGRAIASSTTPLATESLTGASSKSAQQQDAKNIAENVRHVGAKVFYRRGSASLTTGGSNALTTGGERWIDSALTADQLKQAIKIERYSKEYFDLIDRLGREASQYMVFDEPVIVEIASKAYEF